MFAATTLLYPCVLGALCLGAGLLVDRCSGRFLPAPLLLSVGAAALIAVSQLSTYASALAPATPYVIAAFALAGFALAPARVRSLAGRLRERPWLVAVPVLAYVIALAPVLFSGRTSFSSFLTLGDSAVHMMGADYLIRHGQSYAHLDLRNSYGLVLNAYYNSNYPSGADTLYGGSAFLLGLPLIWAFQPFNAFMLATATGPAWLLARRMRLDGVWAALAALTIALPALVYGYELIGSVKEIASLSMILTLGALVVVYRSWLRGPPVRALPFALVLAAGVSALGVAFGAWGLVAAAVLGVLLIAQLTAGRAGAGRAGVARAGAGRAGVGGALLLAGVAAITLLIAAWPTWTHVSGSLRVASNIASTSNPGNLEAPLLATQVFGVWLRGSYLAAPIGGSLLLTQALIALVIVAALLGAVHVVRIRAFPLAGWLALMLLAWLGITVAVTTWASAKTLMLTSPVVMLLAWGGVAALRARPAASLARPLAAVLALGLLVGVFASDALQYHDTKLAPTARYQALASLDARYAGQGPTLFTDFDEYSMYELRDLDVGGPDFVYPPAAVAVAAGGYGDPVDLDRVAPGALAAYPLIVTRRDPASSRPPSAYALVWQGHYYQVWKRRPGAPVALEHVALTGSVSAQCARIGSLALGAAGARLIAAQAPRLIRVSLARAAHPRRWGHERQGLVMSTPGRLSASFRLPASGVWDVWVQGQIMPTVQLSVDGRPIASIAGQLDGNSLVPDTVPPIPVHLAAGRHSVSVTRPGFSLAPGDGGSAVLDAIFLAPAGAAGQPALTSVGAVGWRGLCGRRYQWVEILA